jgi:hypothetical protein
MSFDLASLTVTTTSTTYSKNVDYIEQETIQI